MRKMSREELKADDNTMVKDECGKSHNSKYLRRSWQVPWRAKLKKAKTGFAETGYK